MADHLFSFRQLLYHAAGKRVISSLLIRTVSSPLTGGPGWGRLFHNCAVEPMLGTRNLELDGVEPSARGLKSERGEPLVSPAQLETATRSDGGFAFIAVFK
jgi:hypothetical protein